MDSDDSDRKSKMSFSYWGADKITVRKPVVPKGRAGATSSLRKGSTTPTGYNRESSANAKFGSRLRDPEPNPNRPHSRRTQATPTSRRTGHSEDGHGSARATVTITRPAWDTSTRAVTTTPTATRRARNVSQTSGNTSNTPTAPAARASKASLAAPSEDSGVGLYRQLMAQDSSLRV